MGSEFEPTASGDEYRPELPSPGRIVWMVFAAALVAGSVAAPQVARAQGVDQKVDSLVDEATNHYDNLEIEAAKEKLKKAIKTGKSEGASDSTLARAYVVVGVVEFGATRDKERARKAFEAAVELDSSASIPEVYKTPTLADVMKQARENVGVSKPGEAQQQDEQQEEAEPQKKVEEFTHEPISDAQAGDPLMVEAFVPADLTVDEVEFVFKRYDQDEWTRLELEAKDATRFAKEVPGYRIYTTQVSYYIEAKDPSGEVVASSGSEDSPHQITVLGNADFDPEKAKEEYEKRQKEKEKEKEEDEDEEEDEDDDEEDTDDDTDDEVEPVATGPSGFLDVGVGSAVGLVTQGSGLRPTANPDRDIGTSGLVSGIMHTRLGGGYIFPGGSQLGLYLRFQFLPAQDFEAVRGALPDSEPQPGGFKTGACFGTGIPGDCMLGLKYRYTFTDSKPVEFFVSVGGGIGNLRYWFRVRERVNNKEGEEGFCEKNQKTIHQGPRGDFCYKFDTVRPGWIHFGAGGGFAYKFSESVALHAEAYLQVFLPRTAPNLDINIGPQFRF